MVRYPAGMLTWVNPLVIPNNINDADHTNKLGSSSRVPRCVEYAHLLSSELGKFPQTVYIHKSCIYYENKVILDFSIRY